MAYTIRHRAAYDPFTNRKPDYMKLEIDNVELNFGKNQILNGVYLKAEVGKITGLLGSNGSGKSSLLHIVFGSLKPKYKLVRINNKPVKKELYKTYQVKFLPQKQIVPNFMTLETVFKLQGVSWDGFNEVFSGFEQYKNSKMAKLSGGERKVVETYMILKAPARFVLLDEPFMHLSPLHIELFTTIIQAEKQHKGIIITDHRYRHIIDIADDIHILKDGRTRLIDKLTELEDHGYLSYGTI